jgi:tetratricopeptide (TPR) repeat protein
MIWDNFEPVAGFPTGAASAWTPDEQRAPRDFLRDLRDGQTKVLLTSRRDEPWLGNIYRRVEVTGLTLVEAQELAVRVMQRAVLQPQQIKALPQYNDLLQYLHGNPLAIQVILPELKGKKPDVLLREIQAGEVEFSAEDPAQGRERSLPASLTYRLDALAPITRQRLGLVGLFQGFVDADVLMWMCGADDAPEVIRSLERDNWIRMLDAAAEIGLLRRVGEGYYSVHPALPWFFHDILRQAFSDHLEHLERMFAAVYGSYGRQLFKMFQTNTQLAMTLLRAEESNLMHALRLARQHERWDDLGSMLYGLNNLLTTQGRWVEWERLIADFEAEVTDPGGELLPGREDLWRALLGHRSEIAHYRRDFEREQSIHLRLKDYYESVNDDRNHAAALHQLGRIAEERRQFEEAERWYRQSLAIAEHIGDEYGQATTLHQLGRIAEEQGNTAEAVGFYERAEALVVRMNDPYHLDLVRASLRRVRGGSPNAGSQ